MSSPLKIALIGYGKMGKAIEEIAKDRGHEIVAKIDSPDFTSSELKNADIAIEFTQPEAAVNNIRKCFEVKTPVVVGTTGWYKDFDTLKDDAELEGQCLFTATNFSLGVNLFFALNAHLAKLMAPYNQYQPTMEEIHHLAKLDHPSGTGITLAEELIKNHPGMHRYNGRLQEENSATEKDTLDILCLRQPEVPGTHTVKYQSEIDTIEIKHTAHSRKGFAMGAVLAAEWLPGKKGVFNMKDLLNLNY